MLLYSGIKKEEQGYVLGLLMRKDEPTLPGHILTIYCGLFVKVFETSTPHRHFLMFPLPGGVNGHDQPHIMTFMRMK